MEYHNHTLQTNPRHHEEEPQNTNSHKTPGRQLKKGNMLFFLSDCKTSKYTQNVITKQGSNTHKKKKTMGRTINNESTTTTEPQP